MMKTLNGPVQGLVGTLSNDPVPRRSSSSFPRFANGAEALMPPAPLSEVPVGTFHSISITRESIAQPSEMDGTVSEVQTCSACNKTFNRFCDLNKHLKSHSRPFKCDAASCKYYTLGWPTAKELERHVNDKHASAPRTYPCHYSSCSYQSKRESNCKQHMEKAHGWTYVRSKCNSKKSTGGGEVGNDPATNAMLPYPSPTSPEKPGAHSTGGDFLLFPDQGDHTVYLGDEDLDDADTSSLDGLGIQDSKVFIPWTSPGTRFRKNQTILHLFNQAYDSSGKSGDGAYLMIDPQLSRVGLDLDSRLSYATDKQPLSSSLEARATTFNSTVDASTKEASTNRARSPAPSRQHLTVEDEQPLIRQRPDGQASTGENRSVAGKDPRAPVTMENRRVEPPSRSDLFKEHDEDEDDDEHPRKRFKLARETEFKDTEMPDIFHSAFPDVYHRDKKALYGSCHSSHGNISTLVRHLGRAPHRLHVHERYVHSFDVPGQDLSHIEAGLCRRCWQTFSDQELFNSHLATECDKVSKGKREKWHILYEAFTPMAADVQETPELNIASASSRDLQNSSPQVFTAQITQIRSRGNLPDLGSPQISAPSPATVDLAPQTDLMRSGEGDFVPMAEHRRLRDRVQFLERQQALLIRLAAQGFGLHGHNGVLRAIQGAGPSGSPPDRRLVEAPEDAAGDDDDAVQTLPDDHFDRESLLGHMNSQPTDVDREGLMNEVQQTLTRASSGISSDRVSTIHHVPSSPPSRIDGYQVDRSLHNRGSNAEGLHAQNAAARHQPTSLPDSGYGSDKKRGSLGEKDLGEQLKKSSSLPDVNYTSVPVDVQQIRPTIGDTDHPTSSQPVQNAAEKAANSQRPHAAGTDMVIPTPMWFTNPDPFGNPVEPPHHFDDVYMPDHGIPYDLDHDMFRSPESQELENHDFPLDSPGY